MIVECKNKYWLSIGGFLIFYCLPRVTPQNKKKIEFLFYKLVLGIKKILK